MSSKGIKGKLLNGPHNNRYQVTLLYPFCVGHIFLTNLMIRHIYDLFKVGLGFGKKKNEMD